VSEPLVSVVTPFYNTSQYLAECIESVLAQSYSHFEYILSDNCSTDGSREIAESYARRDSRIRLIRQPRLLTQVQHYNSALSEISESSVYCKMVQADDCIFPESLALLVHAFEQSETIGLVSSYDLKGNNLRGSGYPYPATFLPGKEIARRNLRTGLFVFGSPSTVIYRSSLVRGQESFYRESLLHEDTEKCMEILEHWDFGFVHQVLAYLRADNESISSMVSFFRPRELDHYIIVQRFASRFLEPPEDSRLKKECKRYYYSALAEEAVKLRGPSLWRYQRKGLETINEKLDLPYLAFQTVKEILWMLVNPGSTFLAGKDTFKRLKKRLLS
jgi:glycosyltransferase involved in cell wall biosynthesis